jgi:uncharacterized protein YdiU (UPF0061 family)
MIGAIMSDVLIQFSNSYARLPERFFAHQNPDPVAQPELIKLNAGLAEKLDLDIAVLSSDEMANVFAGNLVPSGAEPISLAYAGHQFGGWSPQLGDGRAVLLGEVVDRDGVRRDIQLKGSGRTPFSRGGDGRAALGPVLREYIVSEAMHAMGVPTTRALAAVKTGEEVLREGLLPGAILTRIASSHVRVGTFEFFAARHDEDGIRTLADYVIERHYPEAKNAEQPYIALLGAVVSQQAVLVSKWFQLGFIHGVMNTDNTSVAGETIDYGPCAFMDEYHPRKVFSSIDQQSRYAFGNQASVLQWNLAQLAQCLLSIVDLDMDEAAALAQVEVNAFPEKFEAELVTGLRAKLGLLSEQEGDLALAFELLEAMANDKADFTNTFRDLADAIDGDVAKVRGHFEDMEAFEAWFTKWLPRVEQEDRPLAEISAAIRSVNPAVIPRNHLVEAAIRAGEDNDDFGPFNALVDEVTRPFDTRSNDSIYISPPRPDEVVHQTFCGT